jgi:quercetin dioxygenase-like cupin family protein
MGLIRRRAQGWSWEGVEPRAYTSGATRHVLLGAADGAADVELRYFEIPAGGTSALERHPHEHAVLILHGRAEVLLGDGVGLAGPGDVVFVAGDELHQLRTVGPEPLGFLCAVRVDRAPRAPA